MTEFIIAEFCHNERVTDCKHIEVKQPLANFYRLDNRKRKCCLNEQVLCGVERSCDVVWLESRAAAELTPHIQRRNKFDLRHSNVDVS